MPPAILGVAPAGLFGMHRPTQAVHALAHPLELPEQGLRPVPMLLEMLFARLGDVMELAVALRLDRGMPDLFQVGEGGVDHARTRYVEPLGALVHGLDDFVAMARLLGEQPEDEELQIDGGQFSAHAEGAPAHVASHEPPAEVAKPVPAVMTPE